MENILDDLLVSQRQGHTQNEFMFHRKMDHASAMYRMDHIVDVCNRIKMFVNQTKDEVHDALCGNLTSRVSIPHCEDLSDGKFTHFLQRMPSSDQHLMYQTDDTVYLKMYGKVAPHTLYNETMEIIESELKLPFPISFTRWLLFQPRIDYWDKVAVQAFRLPIPGKNITYYKVPTNLYIFKRLCKLQRLYYYFSFFFKGW